MHSAHSVGQVITLFTQFRPDYSMEQWPEFFFQLWVDRLFILFTKTVRPRNQLVVPKINQELNEPSYEMVDVKITVTNYGQNKLYFWHFFLVDFVFSSRTTPNVFIVMVLKCTY